MPMYAPGNIGVWRVGRPNQMSMLKRFLRNESGATAIEYGLIAAGISVAIIVVVQNVGTNLDAVFTKVKTALVAAP